MFVTRRYASKKYYVRECVLSIMCTMLGSSLISGLQYDFRSDQVKLFCHLTGGMSAGL